MARTNAAQDVPSGVRGGRVTQRRRAGGGVEHMHRHLSTKLVQGLAVARGRRSGIFDGEDRAVNKGGTVERDARFKRY